jgi:hypothetical protein
MIFTYSSWHLSAALRKVLEVLTQNRLPADWHDACFTDLEGELRPIAEDVAFGSAAF